MRRHTLQATPLLIIGLLLPVASPAKTIATKKSLQSRDGAPDVSALWRNPGDIRSRDLFYGAGGQKGQPQGPFTFLKEDMDGTNPKFSVKDRDGVKWKVKLGVEARPETAASRLVWAAGYYTDEDYFLADFKVENMARLHRGQHQVAADGSMHNVRLKREPKEDKKLGEWEWRDDPFTNTREWSGLRVMMALINNWDLKDENNAVHQIDGQRKYLVSDLGASFGTTGFSFTPTDSKSNIKAYEHSKFITKVTTEYVDFRVPSRPNLIHIFTLPEYMRRLHLEWIGRRIPITDVRWMGQLLGQLSDEQIQSAFRAGGYEPSDVQRFSAVVEKRIAQLKTL